MATTFQLQWDIIFKAADASRSNNLGDASVRIRISDFDEVQQAVTAIMNALGDKTYTPSSYDLSRCADLPDRIQVQKLDPNAYETDFHCTVLLIELKRAMAGLMSNRERTQKNLQHLAAADAELSDADRCTRRFLKIYPNPTGHLQYRSDWFRRSVPVCDAKEALLRALRDPTNTPINQVQLKRYLEFSDAVFVLGADGFVRREDVTEIKAIAQERLRTKQFANPGCAAAVLFVVSTLAMMAIYATL